MEPKRDIVGVLEQIPPRLRGELSIELMDLLLVTKKGDIMPASSAKELLRLWHDDKLNSDAGLKVLLETALYIDPDETRNLLTRRDLEPIARGLRPGGPK